MMTIRDSAKAAVPQSVIENPHMLDLPLTPTRVSPENLDHRTDEQREMGALVHHYLTNLRRFDSQFERRADLRYAFPVAIKITPVDPVTLTQVGEATFVVGKQISVSGLGFFHREAIPHRCFLISVDESATGQLGADAQLLMRTKWCRFVGRDLYESGGQFIKIVPTRQRSG